MKVAERNDFQIQAATLDRVKISAVEPASSQRSMNDSHILLLMRSAARRASIQRIPCHNCGKLVTCLRFSEEN